MRLVIRPEAEADLLQAYSWYEDRRAGLGRSFLEEVTRCLDAIAKRPFSFVCVDPLLRRAVTRRFPYSMYFIAGDGVSTVVAALHMARNPAQLALRVGLAGH